MKFFKNLIYKWKHRNDEEYVLVDKDTEFKINGYKVNVYCKNSFFVGGNYYDRLTVWGKIVEESYVGSYCRKTGEIFPIDFGGDHIIATANVYNAMDYYKTLLEKRNSIVVDNNTIIPIGEIEHISIDKEIFKTVTAKVTVAVKRKELK